MIIKRALCILMLAMIGLQPAANAKENIKQVEAYVNKDIKIVYDNQTLTFEDDGKILNPLLYQGMTYVPLVSLSKLISLEVRWDQGASTMYLGPTEEGISFIDMFPAYSVFGSVYRNDSSRRDKKQIASKIYSSWISSTGGVAYYDLEGKYNALTLKAYSEVNSTIDFVGDNKAVLGKLEIIGKNLPQTIIVDVTNAIQFEMHINTDLDGYIKGTLFIVDAFIK